MPMSSAEPRRMGPRMRAETEPAPRRPAPPPHERRRHEHPGERTHAHPR
uniref:Uncharacterized protein n=1 Tax=Ralstonia pickettii (strain 12D) TaxID=428406 RepID=C6BM29_RALP1